MPKIVGTNIAKLELEFKKCHTLSAAAIKKMFPKASVPSMVWQLQYRKGMVFERVYDGTKIAHYVYQPQKRGVVINGSKRIWEEQHPEHK